MISAFMLATLMWCWDDVGNIADGYRLYWGVTGQAWLESTRVEIARDDVCLDNECCAASSEPSLQPGELFFFVVTAFSGPNESDTEHGEVVP